MTEQDDQKPIKQVIEEAKSMERAGRYDDADLFLTEAISRSADSDIPDLLLERGVVKRMLRDYDKSDEDYRVALILADTDDQMSEAYVGRADISRVRRKDLQGAHGFLDKARDLRSRGVSRARVHNQRGLVYEAEGKFNVAQDHYEVAAEECHTALRDDPNDENAKINLARVLTNYGSALENDNKFDKAYEAHSEALETFEELGDQQGIFNGVIGLGRIATRSGDFDSAIQYYKRAEDIMERTGYERGMAALNLHMADAYLSTDNMEEARTYIEKLTAGVRAGHLTEHDRGVFREMFGRVASAYDQSGMQTEGFDEVRRMFLPEEPSEPPRV